MAFWRQSEEDDTEEEEADTAVPISPLLVFWKSLKCLSVSTLSWVIGKGKGLRNDWCRLGLQRGGTFPVNSKNPRKIKKRNTGKFPKFTGHFPTLMQIYRTSFCFSFFLQRTPRGQECLCWHKSALSLHVCVVFSSKAPLTSANRLERAPHDAFPFPGHKHTRNAERFGSVCAVKSQFVQKWVQVSSHTFGRTSNDLALQDNRGTSAEGCLVQNYVNPDRNYVGFESCPDMLCLSSDFGQNKMYFMDHFIYLFHFLTKQEDF